MNFHVIRRKIANLLTYLIFMRRLRKLKNELKKKGVNFLIIKPIFYNKYNLMIDLKDEGITNELLLAKTREYENTKYFIKFIQKKKPEYIFDIGSNIGYFLILEKEYLPGSKIIGIEPVSKNFNILKKNLLINEIEDVVLLKKALNLDNREIELIVPKEGNWSSVVNKNIKGNIEKVKSITLKELLETYLNKDFNKKFLIRMDIEGYEYNIFVNNNELLKKYNNFYIVIELHPHIIGKEKTIELLNKFKEIGLRIEKIIYDYPTIYDILFKNKKNIYYKLVKYSENIEKCKTFEDLINFIKKSKVLFSFHLYMYK